MAAQRVGKALGRMVAGLGAIVLMLTATGCSSGTPTSPQSTQTVVVTAPAPPRPQPTDVPIPDVPLPDDVAGTDSGRRTLDVTNAQLAFFQTPDKTIYCVSYFADWGHSVRCAPEFFSYELPPDEWDCGEAWGPDLGVDEFGDGYVLCAGDPLVGSLEERESIRVMADSDMLVAGGITCWPELGGMSCVNEQSRGFWMSPDMMNLF